MDNGANWTKVTGPQGDAIFTTDGIDTDNDDYIELTLADGTTKIRLPRYKTFQIGTDTEHTNAAISLTELATDIPLSLPSDLKADSYTAIMASNHQRPGYKHGYQNPRRRSPLVSECGTSYI